jgi:DNA-binding CsgD family transcriptional regulator
MRTNLLKYSNPASVRHGARRALHVVPELLPHPLLGRCEKLTVVPQSARELSEREHEVLRWTALGKTSDEVGMILGLTTRTVNFHISQILIKLNAKNKVHAAVKALQLNLLRLA